MYRFFSACIIFSCLLWSMNTDAQSCCTKAGKDWPALAMNTDFAAAHLSPLPLEYAPAKGSMISFETQDGKNGNAFYVPADKPTTNVLIIFHEWWGLNDYIKREAEKWQGMLEDVDVYAVDLYDGSVATDAATASKLASGLDKKRGETIVKGLLSKVGMDKRIATLGWCMGGSWSFTCAVLAGERSVATVMYYGFPEKEAKNIRPLKSDVLYMWASRDKFITRGLVNDFEKQVEATGHTFSLHTFDADHAFANPSNPKYDGNAAKQAEELTLAFIKKKFQIE